MVRKEKKREWQETRHRAIPEEFVNEDAKRDGPLGDLAAPSKWVS